MTHSNADDVRLALVVMDADDLSVLSANMQDARIAVSDLVYLRAE